LIEHKIYQQDKQYSICLLFLRWYSFGILFMILR
jgi:hypothetical protein